MWLRLLVSDGLFPKSGQRDVLSKGQRAQLRDATILAAHVREGRDVLVSNDVKAFGGEGSSKRSTLCELTKTKIVTLPEFVRLCESLRK